MGLHDDFLPEETFSTCLNNMPQPCVELVVEYDGGILLTRRRNEPANGEWFWPRSRLYKGERLDDAAVRVAHEQHDQSRVVTAPPDGANRYVRAYFERFDIG